MNYNLLAIIILIILILFFMIFIPKNNRLHKNITARSAFIMLFIIAALILFVVRCLVKNIYINGLGDLDTDYGKIKDSIEHIVQKDMSEDEGGGEKSDILQITVDLDRIEINGSSYSDISDIKDMIFKALSRGNKIRVIDDYALEETYSALMEMLEEAGADRSEIEEIRQP